MGNCSSSLRTLLGVLFRPHTHRWVSHPRLQVTFSTLCSVSMSLKVQELINCLCCCQWNWQKWEVSTLRKTLNIWACCQDPNEIRHIQGPSAFLLYTEDRTALPLHLQEQHQQIITTFPVSGPPDHRISWGPLSPPDGEHDHWVPQAATSYCSINLNPQDSTSLG